MATFLLYVEEIDMAWEDIFFGRHALDALDAVAGSEDHNVIVAPPDLLRFALVLTGDRGCYCGISAIGNGQITWHVVDLMGIGLHLMARYYLAVVSVVWFMHCSPKRWCVLLRQRPPPVGFCPPRRRRWGWVSGSFLEQEPIFPTLVREWVLARHPDPSRIVGLGTSFYSQDELWPKDTGGFIRPLSMIKSKG